MKFRNIRVKMKGGKTRIQRAMVLASGKLRFVKNVTRSRSSPSKARHSSKGGTRKMAKKRRFGSRGSLPRTIETLSKSMALAVPLLVDPLLQPISARGKAVVALRRATGYDLDDHSFQLNRLVEGYAPYLATTAAWKGVHLINKLIRRV